jgi:predicted acylesterase/phospholipase RssA
MDQPALYGARVYFFSDPVLALRRLPSIDPELVFYDERERTPPFEAFLKQMGDMLPRNFHLPLRRVMVVHEDSGDHENRAFQLGALGVRGVILSPTSVVRLFSFAAQELLKMWGRFNKTSVCVSGGGVEGYLYALGAARALDVSFERRSVSTFDIYCGVSSGAILASSLAAGIVSRDLISQVYRRQGLLEPLTPGVVFDFATGEVLKRIWDFLKVLPRADTGELISSVQRLIPSGFFRGEKLKAFIERQFARVGCADRFAELEKELYISATDHDTGEHIVFGQEPWRDIRMSAAIRASTALPPFFLPERIKGHWFVDGQLTSSSDIKMALSRGAGLVILIDPMVAYSSNNPGDVQSRGGYFTAIQAVKSLVQTRFQAVWRHAMDMHPDVDFVLFRPSDEVMEAMAGNPMRYRIRTEIVELGYKGTLNQILADYDSLSHKLEKHGLSLKNPNTLQEILGEPLDTMSNFFQGGN